MLYIASDLRSIHLADALLGQSTPTPAIIWSRLAHDAVPIRLYRLTPLLLAALHSLCDQLDAASLTGKLSAERAATAVARMELISRAANESMTADERESGRIALARHPERYNGTLTDIQIVLGLYVDRMGGEQEVNQLEEAARRQLSFGLPDTPTSGI